tara:strand:- start:2672 stop:2890 length:219 start_codon:yes stop_codon:yes gene_type:complete
MDAKQIDALRSFIAQGITIAWRDPIEQCYRILFTIKQIGDETGGFFRDGQYVELQTANATDFCIFNVQHLFT